MARPRSALTNFILSLPRDLPSKEVIARAKAKGMKANERGVFRVETIIEKRGLCGARHNPRYVELRIMRSCVRAR